MIKVLVLQVNTDPANIADLEEAVQAGHTNADGWQMPKTAMRGDLVVWYAAGRQEYVARGWVAGLPVRVTKGFGKYRGQVAGIQPVKPVHRKKVLEDCGFDGGHEGYQTVPAEAAVGFLLSLGLLA